MPANFPSNPTLNQQYSYLGSTWSWSGSYWQLTTSQLVTGINFTYANTAPVAPNPGDRWVDTTTMLELVYVYDGNSYQWIELSSQAPSVNFGSIAANIVPAANITYDLGTTTSRWRDLYLSGNTLYLGAATVSATGSAINLPAGSTVAGVTVATSTEVSTGGGPKITNVQVTNNAWTVLDDTAVDVLGGYVKITGTNFVSGCQVIAGTTTASAVSFISSTELRVQFGAVAAGTYVLYVSNPDGGVALRVNGITFSATPAWQTASSLGEIYDAIVINLALVATGASTYAVTSGSLPPGLSLTANTGVITGTVTGVTVDTTYNFTVTATDTELQDSPRSFSITVTVSDPYFRLTTLLLSGSALSANTVVRDSSTNNFNITVSGDCRSSVFTPYGTGWSNFLNGSTSFLSYTSSSTLNFGTNDFTVECWINLNITSGSRVLISGTATNSFGFRYGTGYNVNNGLNIYRAGVADLENCSFTFAAGVWYHVAVVRQSSVIKFFVNGNQQTTSGSGGASYNFPSETSIEIGKSGAEEYFSGHISNLRVVKGTALYTANFTPATTNLTAVANTSLLTCHVNGFRDASTNNFAITPNGDIKVVNINPFNITNTGVAGSMYFDGTGDYVWTSDNAAFTLGTNNFTIECWVYNNSTGARKFIAGQGNSAGNDASSSFNIQKTAGNKLQGAIASAGPIINSVASSSDMPLNSWVHCAFVREGTTLRLYMNGVQVGTTTGISASVIDSSNNVVLGAAGEYVSADTWIGYIADFRIVNGTCLYPSGTSFTPPTTLLTAVANTQLLTLQYRQPHNNHTFLDNSNNQYVVGRTGNPTQGAFTPFSQAGWSNYFPSTAYLSIGTTAAFSFGTGDFTVEGWIYTNTSSVCMFDARVSSSATPWVLNAGSGSNTYWYDGTSYTSSIGITLGQWNHVAVARQSGVLRIFVNGQQGYSASHTVNQDRTAGIRIGEVVQTGQNWTGYLSNLRIIKGQALYTGAFTPPTTILATNSVGTTGANVAASITSPVSLLTAQSNRFVDNSSNNFALTGTNSPQVQAFSPFGPTAVYNPAVHGGSAYFDGSSDWLYLGLAGSTCHPNLKVPSGSPFSIEFWVYPQNSNVIINLGSHRAAYASEMALYIYYTAAIVSIRTGGTTGTAYTINFSSGNSLVSNEWQHVALVRESNNDVYLYRNGIRGAAVNVPGALDPYSSRLDITSEMGFYVGISQSIWTSYNPVYFQGYLSNLRYVVGTAVYTGNFTPPTAPVTAIANTQLLIDFTDAAILDSTGRNAVETVADARSTSAVTKFTGGSMSFDGTGDYLVSPSNNLFSFGTGDFTIEAWIYATTLTTKGVFQTSDNPGGLKTTYTSGLILVTADAANGQLVVNVLGTNVNTGSTYIAINTWYHVAVTRLSGNISIFLNGVLAGGPTSVASAINGSYLCVGGYYNSSYLWNGYISDFRITRVARYTANFTAPTAPVRLK